MTYRVEITVIEESANEERSVTVKRDTNTVGPNALRDLLGVVVTGVVQMIEKSNIRPRELLVLKKAEE